VAGFGRNNVESLLVWRVLKKLEIKSLNGLKFSSRQGHLCKARSDTLLWINASPILFPSEEGFIRESTVTHFIQCNVIYISRRSQTIDLFPAMINQSHHDLPSLPVCRMPYFYADTHSSFHTGQWNYFSSNVSWLSIHFNIMNMRFRWFVRSAVLTVKEWSICK
jgi:hypothetical protein